MRLIPGIVLLALILAEADAAGCDGGKCNAPTTYTAMTMDPAGAGPEYVKSVGFSSAWEAGIKSGCDMVRNFLGSASGNKFFLYGANEVDANYDAITTAWCDYTQPNTAQRSPTCGKSEKDAAKTFQYPAYMVSGRQSACTCSHYTVEVAPVVFRPHPSDSASGLWELTAHEYTHAVQKAFGGPMPAWLMEGGAVHMQCLMGSIRPAEYGGPVAYSECFKTGGGRSPGIIPNVRTMYGRTDAVNWLSLYGSDRACGTEAVPAYQKSNPLPTDDDFRQGDYIFYDAGALAVAFAIHKSKKTSADFWRSAEGFWHAHIPYGDMDYSTGWESDVPEGKGWRKALANFTGYATSAEFLAAFESFVRPGGAVVSEAAVLAILESDTSIATQAASKAGFAARGPLTPAGCAGSALTAPVTKAPVTKAPVTGAPTAKVVTSKGTVAVKMSKADATALAAKSTAKAAFASAVAKTTGLAASKITITAIYVDGEKVARRLANTTESTVTFDWEAKHTAVVTASNMDAATLKTQIVAEIKAVANLTVGITAVPTVTIVKTTTKAPEAATSSSGTASDSTSSSGVASEAVSSVSSIRVTFTAMLMATITLTAICAPAICS